jgi:hypothetical protein
VLTVLLLVVFLFGWKFFLSNRRSTRVSAVTETLSSRERDDLKVFFQHLLKNTEFGYTLIGTKPVTLIDPECPEKIMLIPTREVFLRGVTILKKILLTHKITSFTICFDKRFSDFYFINNRVFVKTILDNSNIFEHLLSQAHSTKKLLKMVSKSGDFDQIVCNHRNALLGICLGYGVKNSLLWERKCNIDRCLSRQNVMSRIPIKRHTPNQDLLLVPSSEFSSLEQELHYLENLLKRTTESMLTEVSFVSLPIFFCDINSPETHSILEAYRNERKEIRKMLASDDIVERVFDKLLEKS